MVDIIQNKDFIELNYTGRSSDGNIFDTTEEKVAKSVKNYNPKGDYTPILICVGEKQVLPGLDNQLVGKEVGKTYKINLQPELAFGKKQMKHVKLVPLSEFKEHKLKPFPGLQVDFDGQMGTVMRISGGRVMVNFNHPLAGKEVIYEIKISRRITDPAEQIIAYLGNVFSQVKKLGKVEVKEGSALVKLPIDLPKPFSDELSKRLINLIDIKEVSFIKEEIKSPNNK